MKEFFILIVLGILMFYACVERAEPHNETSEATLVALDSANSTVTGDDAETWLYSLFSCKDVDAQYCFFIDVEERVCTDRF